MCSSQRGELTITYWELKGLKLYDIQEMDTLCKSTHSSSSIYSVSPSWSLFRFLIVSFEGRKYATNWSPLASTIPLQEDKKKSVKLKMWLSENCWEKKRHLVSGMVQGWAGFYSTAMTANLSWWRISNELNNLHLIIACDISSSSAGPPLPLGVGSVSNITWAQGWAHI